jgi:hypothetical protein
VLFFFFSDDDKAVLVIPSFYSGTKGRYCQLATLFQVALITALNAVWLSAPVDDNPAKKGVTVLAFVLTYSTWWTHIVLSEC